MGSYASEYRTFFYNLQRYGFTLSADEIRQILITVGIIAFVWSFKFEGASFDIFKWVLKFFQGAIFALIGVFFNQIGQRVVAVRYGYDPIYQYGIMGLLIALVITFASRGNLIFFLPGAINIRHLTASRLGEFRYYTNDWEWAKIGFMGPFFNMFLAILLSLFKQNPLIHQLIIMNIMFAAYSLLPLPGNLGLYLFFPHIYFWTFTLGFVFATSLMVFFLHPLLTLIFGLLFGAIAMYWHFVVKDKRLG